MRAYLFLILNSLFLILVPLAVSAAPQTFKELVEKDLIGIINVAIPAVLALAFLVFIWGLFRYLFFPDAEGNIEKGRNIMVWGILAFFVMLSVWGIVNALQLTFGF